uniref:Uncharacterized protein n=1 Tax=Pseudomonas graminis TaxID=158627 RepID=A0A7C1XFX5_9PSED
MIVPTLRVGMPPRTLRVHRFDAERRRMHYHAERGNDHGVCTGLFPAEAGPTKSIACIQWNLAVTRTCGTGFSREGAGSHTA